jgi:L-threonylcarbamoyladenylate synthase
MTCPLGIDVDRAARLLREGGLVAFPTETVYGLGADALSGVAVARVFEAKERPRFDPLIVHVHDAAQLDTLAADVPAAAQVLIERFWPGPLTLVLRSSEAAFPTEVRSSEGKVAIRCSPHEGVRRILEQWGSAITSTSANLPGEPGAQDANSAAEAAARLGGGSDVLVLDGGPLLASRPSTLVDAAREPPRILRVGALGTEALSRVLGVIDVA